jgi:addiction module HigA family antidote
MPPMYNPPHPGEALREDILPTFRLSIQGLAKRLGCPLNLLASVMQCNAPITNELALQLESADLGRASHWIALQAAYDSWQAQQKSPQQ